MKRSNNIFFSADDSNGKNKNENDNSIFKTGSVLTEQNGNGIYCISIVGQIEGHYALSENQKATKYEHILPLLVSVEESENISGLLILLNTLGGDVEAGLAIAELIASMSKPTVSIVLGGGHSIGVPLAVAAKRSFIVPSATMTLHPVRTQGLVLGVPQSFKYFSEMQDRIVNFICTHSRADKDTLKNLMNRTDQLATDIGSIVDGKEAVELGLIDAVGGLAEAIGEIKKASGKNQK
ncbi:MAG: ATP-dependent Clp protease proteolytic subunit [Clostridia bacterium]|nr:ATP-dependent Clp protease proteolytic subunit [Clostridia bacterium]